ncbi:hypothetical protein B0T17DRAFT_587514 [Bombardia bombarda]|uniref:Uncharacterized protein n=1 Tax=Bombardia bombarda TaxID=252184 RepID=A0AA39XN31_9PEZI|nr:hypothetical protein B0T17DRAFT_587514 [Bombardia bombarda]
MNDLSPPRGCQEPKTYQQQTPFAINVLSVGTNVGSPSRTPTGQSGTAGTDTGLAALLPATHRTRAHNVKSPTLHIDYVAGEFSTKRVEDIAKYLRVVGRPMPPRPLYYQRLLSREIFVTQQMDMHLVWTEGRIFIKPIPRLLLEPTFWSDFLSCERDGCKCWLHSGDASSKEASLECEKRKVWRNCLGFLFSYTALIAYENDFDAAKALCLLPSDVQWASWRQLAEQLLADDCIYQKVSTRFLYGELRLNRLNKIYIYIRGDIRGYMSRWNRFGGFLRDNLTWLLSVFAYIAVILTALRVGLATSSLQNSDAFQSFSLGFTVLSLVGPVAIVVLIVLYTSVMLLWNVRVMLRFENERIIAMGIRSLRPEGSSQKQEKNSA